MGRQFNWPRFAYLAALILAFVFSAPGQADAGSIDRRFSISDQSLSVITGGDLFWLADGLDLKAFRSVEFEEGQKRLFLEHAYGAPGNPIGLTKDRTNAYWVGDEGVVVVPFNHPARAERFSINEIGLEGKIAGFHVGGKLLVYGKTQIAIYDALLESWSLLDEFKPVEDEQIRMAVENYGLVVITTNKQVYVISADGKITETLTHEALAQWWEMGVNDFVITGEVNHLWFSAVKAVLRINVGVDPKTGKSIVVSHETLSPFAEANLSKIEKISMWNRHLVTVYDDGLYAYEPDSGAWQALAASSSQKAGSTPLLDFYGNVTSYTQNDGRILAGTSNHGVLQVFYGEKGFKVERLKLAGLPTLNIQDVVDQGARGILVSVGNGLYQCDSKGESCEVLREPSAYELPAHPQTKFAQEAARFKGNELFLTDGKVYRYLPDGSVSEVTLPLTEESPTVIAIAADAKYLVAAATDTLFVLDERFKVSKTYSRNYFLDQKHVDAEFSAIELHDGQLVVGLKKQYAQEIDLGQELPDELLRRIEEEPDKYLHRMQSAYLVDLKTGDFEGFDAKRGLPVEDVKSVIRYNGAFHLAGYNTLTNRWEVFGLNADQSAWEPFSPNIIKTIKLTNIAADGGNLLAYHEKGVLALNAKGELEAILTPESMGVYEGYPGRLDNANAFFGAEQFGFYSGRELRYYDRLDKQWNWLFSAPAHRAIPLDGGALAVMGARSIRLVFPEMLAANREQDRADLELDGKAADFSKPRRIGKERRAVRLADLVSPEDITFDLAVHFASGTDASIIAASIQSVGATVVDRMNGGLSIRVKLQPGADVEKALAQLNEQQETVLVEPNPLLGLGGDVRIAADELIVSFKPGVSISQQNDLFKKHGLTRGAQISRRAFVAYLPEGGNPVKMSNGLQEESIVNGAELNYFMGASQVEEESAAIEGPAPTSPNDPLYSSQLALTQIGFDQVWNAPWDASHAPIVAVIDSGVDVSHPDLAGRVLDGPDFIDLDFEANDENGHGTHLAGVIAAGINDGTGVAGLCGNCKALRVRVLNAEGAGTVSDIIEAIQWVVDDGRARVINLSLSGPAGTQALWDAVKYAEANGVVVVAPAGNDGIEIPVYPAVFPEVVAVSSVNGQDAFSTFSNFGSYVDVSAPGEGIVGPWPGGGHESADGTSVSAAMVSGLLGAFLSKMNDPTVEQLKSLLYKNAVDLGEAGRDARYGWGRINAAAFLSEESLLQPLGEYFADADIDNISVYDELPRELDIFTSSFFKKLIKAIKKFFNAVINLVKQIVNALVALLQKVADAFDWLYKKILRPILAFFCGAVCPLISFGNNANEAFNIGGSATVLHALSVAGTFCAVGCPALQAIGIIQPYTRMVCEEGDPEFSKERKIFGLENIVQKDTVEITSETAGGYQVTTKSGYSTVAESSVDIMQEMYKDAQASGQDIDIDGLIIQERGQEDLLLLGQQRCWEIEYNPYAKFTKILDTGNQVLGVYNYANSLNNALDGIDDHFDKALTGNFEAAKQVFDDLNTIVAYAPGEVGQKLRDNLNSAAPIIGYISDFRKYSDPAAWQDMEDEFRANMKAIEDGLGQIANLTDDGFRSLIDHGENAANKVWNYVTNFEPDKQKMEAGKVGVEDAAKAYDVLEVEAGDTEGMDSKELEAKHPKLYEAGQAIKRQYRTLRNICKYSGSGVCDEVRGWAHSDFMKAVTLGTGLYDFLAVSKCNGEWMRDAESQANECGIDLKIPNGTEFVVGVNAVLTDDLFLEAWRAEGGQEKVHYRQAVAVPPPSAQNIYATQTVSMDWSWRNPETGKMLPPGDYNVRARYRDVTGVEKVIDIVGETEQDYPIQPGEMFDGAFDDELVGKPTQQSFSFEVDAGQPYMTFDYDFSIRAGAFSVVSTEIRIYALGDAGDCLGAADLIWSEKREMPVLGDEDGWGYDNSFVWNFMNMSTGARVDDGEYDFCLVTTMKSGRKYASKYSRMVYTTTEAGFCDNDLDDDNDDDNGNNPDGGVDCEDSDCWGDPVCAGQVPQSTVKKAGARVISPDRGGIDKYMQYQIDDGVVTGGVDAWNNSFSYERGTSSVEGAITGVVYPDGSRVDYVDGSERVDKKTDRNGNTKTYTYDAQDRVTKIADAIDGHDLSFTYASDANPDLTVVTMTDSASGFITKRWVDNSLGVPVKVQANDGTEVEFAYDARGNATQTFDELDRETRTTFNENDQPLTVTQVSASGAATTTFEYDNAYNLIKMTDPVGNIVYYGGYDGEGNAGYVKNAQWNASHLFEYDSRNRLTKTTDPLGWETEYFYEPSSGRLQKERVRYNAGSLADTTYTYYDADPKKNLTKTMTDARNGLWQYAYDSERNLTQVTDPLSGTETFTYTAAGQVDTATSRAGVATDYTYATSGNAKGMVTSVNEDDGGLNRETTYTYKSGNRDQIDTTTLPNGNVVTYTYESGTNRVETVSDSVGAAARFEYFADGRVKKALDGRDLGVLYAYDDFGRLTSVKEIDDASTVLSTESFAYDLSGRRTSVTNRLGGVVTVSYADSQRQATTADPNGIETTLTFDLNGRPASMTDGAGNVFGTAYDARGMVKSVTDPLGNADSRVYDANGNLTSYTDPKSNVTGYTYDALDRLTRVTDALSGETDYAYNSDGTVDTVTDPLNNTTDFNYDALSRLTSVSNAGSQTRTYTYNADHELESITNRRGSDVDFTYDARGRLTGKSYTGYSAGFAYDLSDNLTGAVDNISDIDFSSYDDKNRLTALSVSATGSSGLPDWDLAYSYDAADNVTSLTGDLDGAAGDDYEALFVYDTGGRLTALGGDAGSFAYTYDADRGLLTGIVYPNGASATFEYDDAGRLTELDNLMAATAAFSFDYTYDANGNRTQIVDRYGTHGYTYDALNRLTTADHPGGQSAYNPDEDYHYDANGNRLYSHRSGAQSQPDAFNALNQLTEDDDFDYTYDADGNLTGRTKKSDSSVAYYTWNVEGQLTLVELPDGTDVTFKYDALGRRVEKKSDDGSTVVTRRYAYDGQNLIAEYDGSNNVIAKYFYDPGIDNVLAMKRGGNWYYYHKDALGSVMAITSAAGAVVQTYTYDSFGVIVNQMDPDFENPFTYTGREWDAETGLYFYRARYYAPELGQFISEDPEWRTNLYKYADNNPLTYVDPDGRLENLEAIRRQYRWKVWKDTLIGGTIGTIKELTVWDSTSKFIATMRNPESTKAEKWGYGAILAVDVGDMAATYFTGGKSRVATTGPKKAVVEIFEHSIKSGVEKTTKKSLGKFTMDELAKTSIRSGDTIFEGASEAALAGCEAIHSLGPGKGAVYGTWVHTAAKSFAQKFGRDDLFFEQSFKLGLPKNYGANGSVRLDIIQGASASAPNWIGDWKTGRGLSWSGAQRIRKNIDPDFHDVTILEFNLKQVD